MPNPKPGSAFGGADALLQPGMWDQLRLTLRLFRDPRVAPRLKMAVPLLAAVYVLSPIDLLPDFFLGAGQIDDLGVIGLTLMVLTRLVPRLTPPDVLAEHLSAMRRARPAATQTVDGEAIVDADFRVRQ